AYAVCLPCVVFADQDGVGQPVGYHRHVDLGPHAAEEAPQGRGVVGVSEMEAGVVAPASDRWQLRRDRLAVVVEGVVTAGTVDALGTHAAHVIAKRPVGLPV